MPVYSYQQISIDPESTGAAMMNAANPIMEPGSVVVKNGRIYLYVLFDSGATVPPNGQLMAYKAPGPTPGGTNPTWTITNVANINAVTSSSRNVVPAGMVYYAVTAGNYGFVQIGGPSFVNLVNDGSPTLAGQVLCAGLQTNTTPGAAVLATTTNLITGLPIGVLTTTPANNVGSALLNIAPYAGI